VVGGRRIPLNGAFNFRDLGGYTGAGGRPVRSGRVYRSDTLANLDAVDLDTLEPLGIRRVFDLRSDSELASDGVGMFARARGRHRHTPLVELSLSPFDPSIEWRILDLQNRYLEMLGAGGHVIRAVIEWICGSGRGATVFHCTGGKDRTGVVAAVILRALGVSDDDIVRDYAASETYLRANLGSFRAVLEEAGLDDEAIGYLTSSPPSRMQHTLARLDERWGSTTGYLAYIGVDADGVALLRGRLLLDRE
jgi:protein-tyrosine phosphatase